MMTAKTQSNDIDKKVASLRSAKQRIDILNSLHYGYMNDIDSKYSSDLMKYASVRSDYKNPELKSDVASVIEAIKVVLGNKYKFRHETVCKITDGNTITITLDFNYDSVKEVANALKSHESLELKKASDKKRLDAWKRKQMYSIANACDFEMFEI